MSFASLSVRRPVLTWVFSAFILLAGVLGISQLGIREYPAIDPPSISVTADYAGANAAVIENQITEPLESALNGIDGIRTLTSQSRDGRSSIVVEFYLGTDLEKAANDVRDRVSRAQRSLPADASPPTVSKADANSSPILILTLESSTRDRLDLSEQARLIQERLQTVDGVAEIRIWGERRYAIRLRIDPRKLARYQLSLGDIRNAVQAENAELPAGQIIGKDMVVSLRSQTNLESAEEFRNLIVKNVGTQVVRLRDVAQVELNAENPFTMLRVNGTPMVALAVTSQPGSNQIAIVDEIRQRTQTLQSNLPPDLTLTAAIDNTRFVRKALREVEETILIAFALVVLVIFLFLRDWRTTLIPVLTIPISLVGVFFIAWISGFSINVLTLLGVVLAIGIVVDDAIVVLEVIYAKIEAGKAPKAAAVEGLQEIFFAIVSTTLVLAAVFTPLLFLQGFTGRLFREFGVVIGGSVIISGFVALTLSGMLASRVLRAHAHHNWFYNLTEPLFQRLTRSYERALEHSLARPWIALPILLATFVVAAVSFSQLKSELAPMEDRSFLSVNVTGPEGANFSYMEARMQRIAQIVSSSVPEAQIILANTSFGNLNSGFFRILLSEPEARQRSQTTIVQDLQRRLAQVDGVRISVLQDQTIRVGGRASQPVQMVLQAPHLDSLRVAIPHLLSLVQQDTLLTTPDADLRFTKPQLDIRVQRDQLRDLGVSAQELAQTLQLAFSGQRYGYFTRNGQQYQVIGEIDSLFRLSPADLQHVQVRNRSGQFISLQQLVQTQESLVPPQLFRFNRQSSATLSAGLAPGVSLGEGISRMQQLVQQHLGPSFQTSLAGSSRDFAESSGSLLQVFLLALLIVYLVLAAQFESFRYPLVILFTVPLALAGALASLWFFDYTLNLFSQIGLVMLVGLVTKNGILIVEFANQRIAQGLPLRHAVAVASAARLRPILMTTLATVLGVLPIALALGAGAESRSPMGVAIIGGLLSSLLLTLLVVPAMYLLLAPPPPANVRHLGESMPPNSKRSPCADDPTA